MACLTRIFTWPIHLAIGILRALLGVLVAAVLVIGGVNAFVWATTSDRIVSSAAAAQAGADAIVVPGASVLADGTPSTILQDRLDTAVALYQAGAAPTILVSGSSSDDGYCEALAMANYLVAQGIPESAIVQDYSGESTYATMWRASNVFGFANVIVATQAYHLPRCIFCAQGLGMTALGVEAGAGHTYNDQTYYSAREFVSNVKDAWQILSHAQADTTTAAQRLADKLESVATANVA